MRSIWSGAIQVIAGLSMPVKLGSTVKDNSLELHWVRKTDGSRVKFTRVTEDDGKEIGWNDMSKGYTAPDGSTVLMDRADFERVYGPKSRVATVLMFTEASNVPALAVKKSYWVQPDTGGDKTYALLAQILAETGKVAIVTFAMRDREAVAVLRPHEGYLVLEALEWDSDMIRPDFAAPADTATSAEHSLAAKLIATMGGKYDHSQQIDHSREAVMEVIQAKIETGQVIKPKDAPEGAPVHRGMPADLTAVLKAAVEAKKAENAPDTRKRTPRGRAA
jgi:DNA end-binding protein Ku